MEIRMILTQEEINIIQIRQQRIQEMQLGLNKIQEDFNRLNNDLKLERITQKTVLKSMYLEWQLEKFEKRENFLTLPDNLELRLENGLLVCEIPD